MKHIRKFNENVDIVNEGIKDKLTKGLAALSLLVASCQSITPQEKEKLKNEIEVLDKQQKEKTSSISYYDGQILSKSEQVKNLETKLGILKSGKKPTYILTLKFQEHKMELSLDRISFEFDIPVDEEFYNESQIGEELGEGSRSFSIGDFFTTESI
jgi:hypothetical protein